MSRVPVLACTGDVQDRILVAQCRIVVARCRIAGTCRHEKPDRRQQASVNRRYRTGLRGPTLDHKCCWHCWSWARVSESGIGCSWVKASGSGMGWWPFLQTDRAEELFRSSPAGHLLLSLFRNEFFDSGGMQVSTATVSVSHEPALPVDSKHSIVN